MNRRRIVVGLLVLLLVGMAVDTGVRAASAAQDLRRAEALLDDAGVALTEGQIQAAQDDLRDAEAMTVAANESLHRSVGLSVGRYLPVLGQNLRSIDRSVEDATVLVHGGRQILGEAEPLESAEGELEVSMADGSLPVDAVASAQRELEVLVSQLALREQRGSRRFLLPLVADLSDRVDEEVQRRRAQLTVLAGGLDLLTEIAGVNGPRRYLLAVANTAESRGSGGMILNYGVLEGDEGTIDLRHFGRIDELALADGVSESLAPADYAARWSGFEPFRRWRQANLAGDFTIVAPVLEEMYTAATGLPVHGVIQIDPAGLAAVLDGVGPVTVPELGQVTGDNVVALTLNEAYVRYPGVEERSDVLGDVAEAAFRRLVEGEVPSLRTLATRLAESVDGRHLLMHSNVAPLQGTSTDFGADGAYPPLDGPDAFAMTIQNLSGNKLDYYLDSSLALTGSRPEDDLGVVDATVTLTNTAPAGATTPQYVFGPGVGVGGSRVGVERALVTVYLPVGASLEAVDGSRLVEPAVDGTEGGRPFATFTVDVPAASTAQVTLRLQLAPRPDGAYEVLVLPSPRVRPTTLAVDLDTGDGRVVGDLVLDRTWRLSDDGDVVAVLPPAYRFRSKSAGR